MKSRGFTLIEILVVLVLVALLASIATPIVSSSILRARESTLKENLFVMRKAIDGYYADNRTYPQSLQLLVEKRYIRAVPVDPVTDSVETWELVFAEEGIIDIHSGSSNTASDGTKYNEW